MEWPSAPINSNVPTTSVGKKNRRRQQDIEENHSNPPTSPCQPAELTPSEITPQQRDALVSTLGGLAGGAGPVKEASKHIQEINACLRGNAPLASTSDGQKLPLDTVFGLCDDLAASHLGINLSVSVHRGESGASKRKRQDRALALDLAAVTERQLISASEERIETSAANVTLAAAGLFGQCLAGWPLPVHGKLVPQLSTWIKAKLSKAAPTVSSSITPYPAAVKELQAAKAGEHLNRLKEIVMLKARVVHGSSDEKEEFLEAPEDENALMEKIVAIARSCRKAMTAPPGKPAS